MTGLYVASNPTALSAQYSLTSNMGALSDTLTRLSTGLRINSGKDDPAGLIASSLLKAQITGTSAAISNTQRANSMIATADSALGQVSNLLNDIKGLVVEAANEGAMSSDQIRANQLQVDASINSIDRIATTTNYGGKKLLDGSMGFTTDQCGGTNSTISNLQINQANFGSASKIAVNVEVQELARKGTLIYNGTGVSKDTTIDITGSIGTKSFTFGAGTSNAAMAEAINAYSDSTGVSAYVEGAAQRGSVTLSSAGANNDIVITANEAGAANGNYAFRITRGDTNEARVVSQATADKAGVIEIQLQGAYSNTYNNVAGMFDIKVEADAATAVGGKSISIIQGTYNGVRTYEAASATTGSSNGRTISLASEALVVGTHGKDGSTSAMNGWTVVVDNANGTDEGVVNHETKTITITDVTEADDLTAAMELAMGITAGTLAGGVSFLGDLGGGDTLTNGDVFTLGGGAIAGETQIVYKEGATVGQIQDLINATSGLTATTRQGVNRDALVKDVLSGNTFSTNAAAFTMDDYSQISAADVVALINGSLGDMFTAQMLGSDTGTGRVTFMDAAVDYGDINLDNALRFTGMDDGPIVRISNLGADGTTVKNQQLSIQLIQPSEADIAAGIHTPILQINLATDAQGNSITTAADIAALFDQLTPEQTGGISAEVLYPDGVDPNGRVWVTDECGNVSVYEDCAAKYGLGIVQPTSIEGECGTTQNDLVLLGENQTLVDDYAYAEITSTEVMTGVPAVAATNSATAATVTGLTFGATSALNGVSFAFTLEEGKEGFDESTGKLTVFVKAGDTDGATLTAFNDAIRANWEGIRAYTKYSGSYDSALHSTATAITNANAVTDAGTGAYSTISAGDFITGSTTGVDANEAAMKIVAKDAGTAMAGIRFQFVQDTNLAETTANTEGTGVAEIDIQLVTGSDGTRTVVIKANAGAATNDINAQDLAEALMASTQDIDGQGTKFSDLFDAQATVTTMATAADGTGLEHDGTVAFSSGITSNGVTQGGYRVDSSRTGDAGTGTSKGILMTGQSDDNERLVLQATEYGSEHFVKVSAAPGSEFRTFCPLGYEMCELAGTDIVATINGNKATGRGTNIEINSGDLSLSMDVANQIGSTSFNITGGGALFQLGPDVVSSQQMRLGIPSIMSTRLGGSSGYLYQLKSGGDADLTKSNASRMLADAIVNDAISSVANTRGYLGAIQKSSLEPNISVLQDSLVALTEANSLIEDADFAEESSNLTRLQLLVQAGMQTLGIANQFPQYAASLVR